MMQILPFMTPGEAAGPWDKDWTLNAGSDSPGAFAEVLHQQVSMGNAYGPNQPTGGHKVSREEFSAMREDLHLQGYAAADLDRLEQRVAEGVTWREFMRDLSDLARRSRLGNAREMSPENAAHLQSLFQKAGFTTTQAESLVSNLASGNTRQVLQALKNQLANLPSDKTLTLTPAELKALGESMELTGRGQESLRSFMGLGVGANGRMVVTSEALRGIITVLHNESSDGIGYAQRVQAMQQLVGDILRQAQDKASGEAKADRLGQDSGDKLLDASKQDKKLKPVQGLSEQSAKAADKAAGTAKDENAEGLAARTLEKSSLPKGITTQGFVLEQAAQARFQANSMVNPTASTPGGNTAANSQIFQQVQSGMLQNLGNGSHQLTIQLSPEHLGSLQVMLQVRDKEISGVIRAESPEAARALGEQLGQLRLALEQQGLRVGQLEVQTGPTGQNSYEQWAGSQGHNLMQERQEHARMQRLSALRGQAGTGGVADQDSRVPQAGGIVTSDMVDIFA